VIWGIGCDRKFEMQCNLDDVFKCSAEQGPDSVAIVNSLIGKWRWESRLSCANAVTDDPKDEKVFADLVVEFHLNGTGDYSQNNTMGLFEWRLERVPSGKDFFEMRNSTGLSLSPHASLGGIIYICDNQLVFSARNNDGYDNRFTRE
jgi:hypothetical protein